MFITTYTAKYSLGQGLSTHPAVPMLIQPSSQGRPRASAFELTNSNNWRWWMWMVAAVYRQTHRQSVGLVWGLAHTQLSVSTDQLNRLNSRNDLDHDDSTINIVVINIIIIFAYFRTIDTCCSNIPYCTFCTLTVYIFLSAFSLSCSTLYCVNWD